MNLKLRSRRKADVIRPAAGSTRSRMDPNLALRDRLRGIAALVAYRSVNQASERLINSGDYRKHGVAISGRTVDHRETRSTGGVRMSISLAQQFEASLPGLSKSIRIMTQHDAEVFTCRWTIRDKDPALKALLREMKRANSSATATSAILGLKQALASRGLLGRVGFA
jgi:hypothetical protein